MLTTNEYQKYKSVDLGDQLAYDLPNMSAFAFSYSVNSYEVSTEFSAEKSLSPSVVITCQQNDFKVSQVLTFAE